MSQYHNVSWRLIFNLILNLHPFIFQDPSLGRPMPCALRADMIWSLDSIFIRIFEYYFNVWSYWFIRKMSIICVYYEYIRIIFKGYAVLNPTMAILGRVRISQNFVWIENQHRRTCVIYSYWNPFLYLPFLLYANVNNASHFQYTVDVSSSHTEVTS